jgi:hypothetical protein
MDRKKMKILNQKGFSLIQAMMAVLALSAAGVATFKVVNMNQKTVQTAKKVADVADINGMIMNRVRALFLETKSDTGERTKGICSLVRSSGRDSHLALISMALPKLNRQLFSSSRWEEKFSVFESINQDSECQLENSYGKCFNFVDGAANETGVSVNIIRTLQPKVVVNIKPIQINPLASKPMADFAPSATTKYDVKSIGFSIKVKTFYNQSSNKSTNEEGESVRNYKRDSRTMNSFIWAAEANECDYGDKILALVGTGLGDTEDRYVFNQGGFSENSQSNVLDAPFSVTPNMTQAQNGKLSGEVGSRVIATDDETLVFSSCNEVKYRCPQANQDHQREYDNIRQSMQMRYVLPNKITSVDDKMHYSPNFLYLNETTAEELTEEGGSFSAKYKFDKFQYIKQGNSFFAAVLGVLPQQLLPLFASGNHTLEVNVQDNSNFNTANGVCRKICKSNNNYNTSDLNKYLAVLRYKVNVENIPEGISDTVDASMGPVACTACYLKNCDQFGYGTFGAMNEMPTEPADAGVPECVVHESIVNNFFEYSAKTLGESNASKCVAVKMKETENEGFEYQAANCSDQKQVLCFNFGKHLLAKSLTTSAETPVMASGSDGANICFQTSKETVKPARISTLSLNREISQMKIMQLF